MNTYTENIETVNNNNEELYEDKDDYETDNEYEGSCSDNSYSSDTWINTITHQDYNDLCGTIEELIQDYVNKYICKMSSPSFYVELNKEITENIFNLLLISENCEDFDYKEIEDVVLFISNNYFENNSQTIPLRSIKHYENMTTPIELKNLDVLQKQIEKLTNIKLIKQRSPEWYEFRNQLITASNIWKVFGSQSQINSIIYEKCKAYTDYLQLVNNNNNNEIDNIIVNENTSNSTNTNLHGALHWGVKYEAVSVMIYEKMFNTKVSEFGCVQHSVHNFIGASPDGINTDINSPLYGRMIEIKNIFNREITGVPKEEYWIQTQVQMETCELDECDFIETRFKEFLCEDDFYNTSHPLNNETPNVGMDDSSIVNIPINELKDISPNVECPISKLYQYKGVILYFIKKCIKPTTFQIITNPNTYNEPHYVYMPLTIDLNPETVNAWINTMRLEKETEYTLFNTIYWGLDEISCVLIQRNRLWFQSVFPKIQTVWNIIQNERVSGYAHRCAKKKVPKTEITEETKAKYKNKISLIKCDEFGNIIQ
jgi:hypothetical protein